MIDIKAMNDTVTKLMGMIDDLAYDKAEIMRYEYETWHTEASVKRAKIEYASARQALQDELVKLFTPLTDEQINPLCKETWVADTVKQWVRAIEAMHGITGEKNEHC